MTQDECEDESKFVLNSVEFKRGCVYIRNNAKLQSAGIGTRVSKQLICDSESEFLDRGLCYIEAGKF